VNVIVVLSTFDVAKAAGVRDAVVVAGVAIRLRAMFVTQAELADAVQAFAVKFQDVRRRHRVLFGDDPFAGLAIPRAAVIARLRQVLLNLALRLRGQFVARGDDEHALARVAAEAAGPLRACAAEILELEGTPAPSPREALRAVAGTALEDLSAAREGESLSPGKAAPLVTALIAIAESMRERVARLS
jgi:hypothetical protein